MSTFTLKSDPVLSNRDRELIVATQSGLPLVSDPWAELGKQLDMPADEVLSRFQRMQEAGGVIRRVAAVPDHYRLGFRFNGMTVWDVSDDAIAELGEKIGCLPLSATATGAPPGTCPTGATTSLPWFMGGSAGTRWSTRQHRSARYSATPALDTPSCTAPPS